jgi:PAS domain S-box-containing protein
MLTSIALLLIIAGAIFLAIGLRSVRRILREISGTTVSWRIILILILIFLTGYIAYGFVLINQPFAPVTFIVAFIFAAGGIFVSLIVNLVAKSMDDVKNFAILEKEKNQLEVAQKQLKQLLDNTSEGILVFTTEGFIQEINAVAMTLFGYKQNELIGRELGAVLVSDNNDSVPHQTSHFLNQKLKHLLTHESNIMGKHKNGHTIPMRIRVTSIAQGIGQTEEPVYTAWLTHSTNTTT